VQPDFPDSTLKTVMGSDQIAGQCLLFTRTGWRPEKASQHTNGLAGYDLVGEAVTPGLILQNVELGSYQHVTEQFPEHTQLFEALVGI
jgi:predicted cupin superfamily sugar epimerase